MPSFSTEVPHHMGKSAAKARLESFLSTIEKKYKGQIGQLQGDWLDDVLKFSFSTFGIKIDGRLTVEEDKIVLDGELPFSAMMFKGKISQGIKDAIEKELATAE